MMTKRFLRGLLKAMSQHLVNSISLMPGYYSACHTGRGRLTRWKGCGYGNAQLPEDNRREPAAGAYTAH